MACISMGSSNNWRPVQPVFLRTISFLSDLSDTELALFDSKLIVRIVLPGKKIIEEGKPVEAFYIVVKGLVHVRRNVESGGDVLLGRIGPGGFFGEVNLFDPGTATATVTAVENVSVASIEYPKLLAFMSENPAAGYKITSRMMAEMCRRLRLTNQRLVSSVFWWSSDRPPMEEA